MLEKEFDKKNFCQVGSHCLSERSHLITATASYMAHQKSNIDKLQRLQNSLARVVMCTGKFDHITPVLATLHWLPISARITFKVALLTRKVLTTQQPAYLSSLVRVNQPTRQLRPSSHRVSVAAQHRGLRSRVVLFAMRLLLSGINCPTFKMKFIVLSVCLTLNEIWNRFSINNHSLFDHVTGPRLRFFFSVNWSWHYGASSAA